MNIINQLNKLKIGYVAVSPNLRHPSDRRFFCYYAKRRKINFEIAQRGSRYDLLIVHECGDLTVWQRTVPGTKVIFILENSYFAMPKFEFKNQLRGVSKFITRQHHSLQWSYTSTLERMCRRSDAVLCTTEEQRQSIQKFCPNIHVILAFQDGEVQKVKQNFKSGEVFKFVWEGMAGNLPAFLVIHDALKEIQKRHRFTLHLVTDIEYYRWLRNVSKASTKNLIRKVLDVDEVYLYEWNEEMFSTICTACDLALIPIPLDKPMYAGKPENKLLLFWRMGIPVVTSATPAYIRAMQGCGLSMTCQTTQDWVRVLERYMEDETARREAGQAGMAYAAEAYGDEVLLKRLDNVFESVVDGHYQT